MFIGVRPFDWLMLVVEILVLALIAYEIAITLWRKHVVNVRVARLFQQMSKGQELQKSAPHSLNTDSRMVAGRWVQSAREWSRETESLLASYSAQATAAFVLDTSGEMPPWYASIESSAQNQYSTLVVQLDNLRGIMEKPDVYF
jgi:hypothetical protein